MSDPRREAARAGHAKFVAELETKREFQVVNNLVQGRGGDQDLLSAMSQIIYLTTEASTVHNLGSNLLGNHLYDTACSVLEVAKQNGAAKQSTLIKFLLRLRPIHVWYPGTKEPLRHNDEEVWTDLPTFGYTFADELGSFDPLDKDNTPEEERCWENLTCFVAKLSSACEELDMSGWALTAFSYAFKSPESTDAEEAVRAASLWFVHGGDRLWSNVKTGKQLGGEEKGESDGPPDFNREAWDSWRRGLVNASERFTGEETRKIVSEALAKIEELERQD